MRNAPHAQRKIAGPNMASAATASAAITIARKLKIKTATGSRHAPKLVAFAVRSQLTPKPTRFLAGSARRFLSAARLYTFTKLTNAV